MNKSSACFPFFVAMSAFFLAFGGKLVAGESFELETKVYVFNHGDFRSITLPTAKEAHEAGDVAFHSPASLTFDDVTLSLAGGRLAWSGGGNAPERFKPIETPLISLTPGKAAALLSTLPIQYLEKAPDGNLKVREIPAESPDAPHWKLTFKLGTEAVIGDEIRLVCEVDVASVGAREQLAGVTLPVGKPVLARFNQKIDLAVLPGEWSGFVVPAVKSSDATLLTLLKVVPTSAVSKPASAGRLMSAQELAQFVTYYYQHPQPERIARAIESLGRIEFQDMGSRFSYQYNLRAYTCIGFFAEIFASNPAQLTEWRKVIEDRVEDGTTRTRLRKALSLSRPGTTLVSRVSSQSVMSEVDENHVFLGAFFASGNPVYIRKLVDQLQFVDDANQSLFDAGGVAMVSLAYNAPHHPLMRQTLETVRREVKPRTRELIDDVLNKDLASLLQELLKMDRDPNSEANDRNQLPWRRPLDFPRPGSPGR